MVHLITGYAGYEHIKSSDDGEFNAAFFGDGQYVMETGNQFNASIIDNNTVRVLDGNGLMFGRHFNIEKNSYEDVTITSGTAGTTRTDLICVTYKKNEEDGTETAYLEVIKGANGGAVPAYTTGNILNGAVFNQMPLYKVSLSGVVLSSVTPMFETIPTYKGLAELYAEKFQSAVDSYKKAGTYTGNGSGTTRYVTIGEGVKAVIVTGENYMALVTGYGAIYKKSTETTVSGLTWTEVMITSDGRLKITTDSAVLNKDAAIYTYQAL